MIAFTDVVEDDARAFIAGYGKADAVGATVFGHSRTVVGIAQIAEFPQLGFCGNGFISVGVAGTGETCAKGQTPRKRPTGSNALGRKEVGASHGKIDSSAGRRPSKDDL